MEHTEFDYFIQRDIAKSIFSRKPGRYKYDPEKHSVLGKNLKLDLRLGIGYCNGLVAFRVLGNSPILVEDLLASNAELDELKKILKVLKVKPLSVKCKYGLDRVNDEVRDLCWEKQGIRPTKKTLKRRAELNNQIAFLRQISALCLLQNEIDKKKTEESVGKTEDTEVSKIKKLIGI